MPFAEYKDFADCVAKNKGKSNPEAYCGAIKSQVEGSQKVDDLGPIRKLTETSQSVGSSVILTDGRRGRVIKVDGQFRDVKLPDGTTITVGGGYAVDIKEQAETSQDNMDKKATETPDLVAVIKKKEEEDKHPGTIENMPEETSGKRIFEESVANLQRLSAEAEEAQGKKIADRNKPFSPGQVHKKPKWMSDEDWEKQGK